jgi:hypothetical protein
MNNLNPRQLKFVERYLATGNASKAYIDAGYRSRGATARAAAARLLTKASVRAALDGANLKAAERLEISADWVTANMKKLATFRGKGWSHMASVRATELLGRRFGLFEKQLPEQSATNGEPNAHDYSLTKRIDELTDVFIAAARRQEGNPAQPEGSPDPQRA